MQARRFSGCLAIVLIGFAAAVKAGWLSAFDRQFLSFIQSQAGPSLAQAAAALTHFGDSSVFVALMVAVSVALVSQREGRAAFRLWLAFAVGLACQWALRLTVDQWRPETLQPPGAEASLWQRYDAAGFTSGHALRAALLYGWAALRAWRLPALPGRAAAILFLGLAAAVGLTRLVLNRHWPTDVLGAWLVAGMLLPLATEAVARARKIR